MRLLHSLFLFLLFSSLLLAAEVPKLHMGLNDFAGVVNPQEAAAIDGLVERIRANGTAEIAVLVVNSTGGTGIAQYSVEAAQKNGIGKKGVDNGILMVIAVQDREWRIDVGYGLEGALPDGKIGRIGREHLVPYLAKGEWGAGIYSALSAIGAELGAEGVAAPEPAGEEDDAWLVLLVMGMFGIIVLFSMMAALRRQKWRTPKSGTSRYGGFGGMGGGFAGGGWGGGGGFSGGFGGGSFGGGGAGGKF